MHSSVVYKVLLIGFCFFTFNACKNIPILKSRQDSTIEQKVDALLDKMTLEEKIGQMSQVRHFDDITDGNSF